MPLELRTAHSGANSGARSASAAAGAATTTYASPHFSATAPDLTSTTSPMTVTELTATRSGTHDDAPLPGFAPVRMLSGLAAQPLQQAAPPPVAVTALPAARPPPPAAQLPRQQPGSRALNVAAELTECTATETHASATLPAPPALAQRLGSDSSGSRAAQTGAASSHASPGHIVSLQSLPQAQRSAGAPSMRASSGGGSAAAPPPLPPPQVPPPEAPPAWSKAALEAALDAMAAARAPFLGRFVFLGAPHRRAGGQGVIQFASCELGSGDVAIKFFSRRAAFEREEALYTRRELRSMMPAVVQLERNEGGTVRAPGGYVFPPCIVVEKGEVRVFIPILE